MEAKTFFGGQQIGKIFYGNQQISKVYYGNQLVYQCRTDVLPFIIYDSGGSGYRYGDPDNEGPLPFYYEAETTPTGDWYTYTNNDGYSTIIFTELPYNVIHNGCRSIFEIKINGTTYGTSSIKLNTPYTFKGSFQARWRTSTNRVVNGSNGLGRYSQEIKFYLE